MAIRFADGFDHYAIGDIANKWSGTSIGTASAIVSGRFTGNALQFTGGNFQTATVWRDFGASFVSFGFGFALNLGAYPITSPAPIIVFGSGSTEQFSLSVTSTGSLALTYAGTALASTGTGGAIVANHWNYIEVQGSCAATVAAGACKIRLNGSDYLTLNAGVNTQQGNSSDTVSRITISIPTDYRYPTFINFDDLYFLDFTGSVDNALLGDSRIETLFPIGAGDSTQWSPNGSSANWSCVNEATVDGDTTYVSDATLNDLDLYSVGSLSSTPTSVYAVILNLWARKDDNLARSVAGVLRVQGSDYVGPSASTFSSYLDTVTLYDVSPQSSAAWTASDIATLQIGVKVTG